LARLFKREAAVTIAKPQTYTTQQLNAVVIKDLRVTFDIEKHIGKEPNTCEVRVYNLAERSRYLVQNKPLYIRLEAGYDGFRERLFSGDLVWAQSMRESVDWETRLLLGDGDRAFRFARVNRSYRSGITIRAALRDAASSMGFTLPPNIAANPALDNQFVSGLALHGNAADEVTRLLKPLGLDWSIQDGRLQILDERQARPGEAIVISQDSGMIGVPEYGTPEKKSKPPVLTVKTLLRPGIIPGGLIKVEAAVIKGVFKVERVRHVGDTHGEDWFSEIEARQVRQ
jgi:hypothetical protein